MTVNTSCRLIESRPLTTTSAIATTDSMAETHTISRVTSTKADLMRGVPSQSKDKDHCQRSSPHRPVRGHEVSLSLRYFIQPI